MAKEEHLHRFGPGRWVTLRETGEHVRIEAWSVIAAAYRVRAGKTAVRFATESEIEVVPAHPEEHLGKYWSRCRAMGCGAPLTEGLVICPACKAPTCTCGRCQCVRVSSRKGVPRAKASRKLAEAGSRAGR